MQNSFYTNTELIGLIGYPIKQSYSPLIHNIAAELTGAKIIYLPFEVHSTNLKNAVKGGSRDAIINRQETIAREAGLMDYIITDNVIDNIIGNLENASLSTESAGILEVLKDLKNVKKDVFFSW